MNASCSKSSTVDTISAVSVRAALFDVGGTLVDQYVTGMHPLIRQELVASFGERDWYDALIGAEIEPHERAEPLRQETNRWYEAWFAEHGIVCDIDIDRLRATFAIPLDLITTPVPGAYEAVRWCKAQGLAVVLVTNVVSRGDAEVLRDWQRVGLADAIDGIVSSHDVGWRKPHRAMFDRALDLGKAAPGDTFMVGDDLEADVRGAQRLGLRTVWRRRDAGAAPPAGLRPDATITTLLELPEIVRPWL
jgi:HAD superfamily hydrolase (TIGR01509 family)